MRNSKKGFTIIEVVLVLAIGGLIFLMVFIALPALQRSQRDAQRNRRRGQRHREEEIHRAQRAGFRRKKRRDNQARRDDADQQIRDLAEALLREEPLFH